MMRILFTLILGVFLFASCKKDEPALKEDLYLDQPLSTPSNTTIAIFQQNVSFYQLFIYRFDPIISKWTARIGGHFSTIPASDPAALGFTNPYVADSGVPLFDMVKIYTTETGTTNIKTVKINADKVLQFFPDYAGSKTGIVRVVEQDIILTRLNLTTFKIGISGNGTYDENTKIIDLDVKFNEAAIGGASQTFKYKMSPTALILN
ncbi:MAG: hypothetical protein H7325_04555 [Pedobacter sp.]|nr:hypothetical protein [Pedobacter sp.]